jgi:hypothetical protein
MQFTVLERMLLLNILPDQGDVTTLRINRKLKEALSFSEEEHAMLKFEFSPEIVKWEEARQDECVKEVEVGHKAMEIVAKRFRELSDQRKLHEEHLPLYDRFNPAEV